ncbi:MAG: hypothetical protein JNM07_02010 [Phycisphaerae bacterium]|nr:hypothetical protein [Phycisphaerae bacterium]
MSRSALVFDDGLHPLGALRDLRAIFQARTGALTTLERLAAVTGLSFHDAWVPEALAPVVRERAALPIDAPFAAPEVAGVRINTEPRDQQLLIVNGRCVAPPQALDDLAHGEAWVEGDSGELIAVSIPAGELRALAAANWRWNGPARRTAERCLLSRPWHVRAFRDTALDVDLKTLAGRLPAWSFAPGDGVFVIPLGGAVHRAPSARIGPGVVLDAEAGPIVLDEHCIVRPGATIIGPAYLGRHSVVLDRAIIKPRTAIGPWCKIAGEVGGTVIQGFTNKSHDGHLGDSWVGEWVNLGAGTTNSNLLNTYGEVTCRAGPLGPMERTGQVFLGATIGDHVKTAIGTRLMTGVQLGTGAMYAATAAASGLIDRFAWITDAGAKPYRSDRFEAVARAAMSRRGVTPGPAYLSRLADLSKGS